MEQDKQQEEFVNCKTDKKTENSTKREPNPKPMHKIFDNAICEKCESRRI